MKVKCAWCGKDMGTKPGGKDDDVSHSCCAKCANEVEDVMYHDWREAPTKEKRRAE